MFDSIPNVSNDEIKSILCSTAASSSTINQLHSVELTFRACAPPGLISLPKTALDV
ncbi:hypothetical protein WN48_02018 [Eufriesea mexicana]|uniref:Uncharacterized protein n=1 Tax=Eufriesea mexicana TaxID=516756 RepID=A0A310SLP6_9HYME|nr:hypothetical protein WN48_02018 [Eufriesea mexicana]